MHRFLIFIVVSPLPMLVLAQDDCPYDLDGSGFVNAGEILQFLAGYGAPGNIEYDFNDNGVRDFEDARIFSRYQGYH